MKRLKLQLVASNLFVALAIAYGPIPQPRPQVQPQIDTSPWTPIRAPKYYYGPPSQPTYGMRVPTPKPYQSSAYPSVSVPQIQQAAQVEQIPQLPSASPWMPIVQEQAPKKPAQQEMAVVFQLQTKEPAPASEPPSLSLGRLPVPLIFRNPPTAMPAVEPATEAPSSGVWQAPAQQEVGQWQSVEPQELAPPQSLEPSAVPVDANNEPLAPPGTFWPLSDDPNAPVRAPEQPPASQEPNSLNSWPDTPKDVPGAELIIPPLGPPEFGQFAVPPAG